MKRKLIYLTVFLFVLSCDRQIPTISNDNPFDSENELTGGDPFYTQTVNSSDHITISWSYTFGTPTPESYNLYRIDHPSEEPTLRYSGTETTFDDDSLLVWDSTYSYYVTAIIGGTESTPPDISVLPHVVRRIFVGAGQDFSTIQSAIDDPTIQSGDMIYVKDGTYNPIDFGTKYLVLRSENGPENCIIDGSGNGTVITIEGGQDSTTVLDGFTIRNGSASKGGGLMIDESSPTIQNCIITGNEVSRDGGGLYIDKGSPRISDCTISGNTAGRDGAGIYFKGSESSLVLENVTFSGNMATGRDGGGGLFVRDGSAQISGCLFLNNETEKNGGAIYSESAILTLEGTEIRSNMSVLVGGGIFLGSSDGFLALKTIFYNNTGGQGGGIYVSNSDSVSMTNCIFYENNGPFGGGGFFVSGSNLNLEQCTLSENASSQNNGGGMLLSGGSVVTVHNSIFWNDNAQNGSEFQLEDVNADSVLVTFSDIDGGWEGDGNIDANPLFEDAASEDFDLQSGSPCEGTGENGYDMGAYGGVFGNW